jgi:hypothetical protein
MTELGMTIRENSRAFRKNDYGLENALAKYVRNRWPDKTVGHVAHEWDLSESEAAKVVYANASKNTLNKILHHKRGGPKLFVGLVFDATNTTLEQYITQQARDAEHERNKWEAEEHRLALLQSRLSGCGGLDRTDGEQARTRGSTVASLGNHSDGPPVAGEPRAFDASRSEGRGS